MSTLAQIIVETAAKLEADAGRKARAPTGLTFSSSFGEQSPFLREVPSLVPDLKRAMRFKISDDVGDAVVKMRKTPAQTLLQAFNYARLPYPVTWIEYSSASGKFGWLLNAEEEAIRLRVILGVPVAAPVPIFVGSASSARITSAGIQTNATEKTIETAMISQSLTALSILLLLNSRSQILKTREAPDVERLNKKRVKAGREEILPVHDIVFDVARMLVRHPGLPEGAAAEAMAAALVRGHFKLRKTGVFFWSPYVRGAQSEEERDAAIVRGTTRDRQVRKSGPSVLPRP